MTRLLRLGEVSGRRPWLDAVPPAEREPVLGEGGGLPHSVEGEDGAAVVGEVDVELRGRVVVRHHRQDRGHDKARRLRPRVRCAHEDVHAGEPFSEPAPTINEAVSAKMCPSLNPAESHVRDPRLVHHQRIFCAWTGQYDRRLWLGLAANLLAGITRTRTHHHGRCLGLS